MPLRGCLEALRSAGVPRRLLPVRKALSASETPHGASLQWGGAVVVFEASTPFPIVRKGNALTVTTVAAPQCRDAPVGRLRGGRVFPNRWGPPPSATRTWPARPDVPALRLVAPRISSSVRSKCLRYPLATAEGTPGSGIGSHFRWFHAPQWSPAGPGRRNMTLRRGPKSSLAQFVGVSVSDWLTKRVNLFCLALRYE